MNVPAMINGGAKNMPPTIPKIRKTTQNMTVDAIVFTAKAVCTKGMPNMLVMNAARFLKKKKNKSIVFIPDMTVHIAKTRMPAHTNVMS